MSEKRNVIFILDGGPMADTCSLGDCKDKSVGTFEVVDDDSNEYLMTAQLCEKHATKLGTGYFPVTGLRRK